MTYPDLELIPAIAEVLGITSDALLGMPQMEKEKKATEVFDELRRQCIKTDYDSDKIVDLLHDIRRNYLDSDSVWRPWCEGNGRAFRDPKILPEVRLFAQAYLERSPMDPHVLETMAEIEDEESVEAFLKNYTTPFDCSARRLLFQRYLRRGDYERLEPERRYHLYMAFSDLLCLRYLLKNGQQDGKNAAEEFMQNMLALIRSDAVDERPDIWTDDRLELGIKAAARFAQSGKTQDAITVLEAAVKLLEETMSITKEVALPTSCRFLDGMQWAAKEDWHSTGNDPDALKQRMIYIFTRMSGMSTCYCIYPSNYYQLLTSDEFISIKNEPEFEKLCARVKALIVTKTEG